MPTEHVHPAEVVDGALVADGTVTVEAYQLTPGDVVGFVAWAGGPDVLTPRLASGGVAVIVGGAFVGQVELGDYLLRRDGGLVREPFDGFWNRYIPAQSPDPEEG